MTVETTVFAHLVDRLLPGGGYVMAFHEFHMDESYTDKVPHILSFGGYLIQSEQAKRMDAEWRDMLGRYKVPYLHMKDLAPCEKLYKSLGMPCCTALATEAIGLIRKYVAQGFVVLANPKTFTSAKNLPYVWCLKECLTAIAGWMSGNAPNDKVQFFLECGHKHATQALETVREQMAKKDEPRAADVAAYFNGIDFGEKEEMRICQAADLLVWHARKFAIGTLEGRDKPRGDFLALVEDRHSISYMLSDKNTATIKVRGRRISRLQDRTPADNHPLVQETIRALFADPSSVEFTALGFFRFVWIESGQVYKELLERPHA